MLRFCFKQGSRLLSPPALPAHFVCQLTKQNEYGEEGHKTPLHTLISLVLARKISMRVA